MNMTMMIAGLWRDALRAPDDAGAGGGAGGGAPGAGDPPGGAPGAEGGAGGDDGTGAPAGGEGGKDAGGSDKPWHAREGSLTGPERDWLRARGMLTDDAAELLPKAIRGHMAAEKALGKGADKLMDRPKEGQPVAEWLRENGKAFGIPDAPDGYEIAKPEMPEGMGWDEGLEAKFRALAHEQAMTPDQFNAGVGLFAAHMKGIFEGAQQGAQTAQAELRQELDRDWGDQYGAKVQQAQAAFQAIASEAGLDHEQQLAAAELLKPKIGDAGIMRMFAAIGAKMGDDAFVGGGGAPGLTTPQEAKAELQRFTGPDGEYGKAFAAGDQRKMRQLEGRRDQLTKIAAGGR